jgi:8-oxo-dGTP diphosphatase
MVKYVVGFLFNGRGDVALILKTHPEWQKGRLNGIGGHIEPNETPEMAMRREFCEESGIDILDWREFCVVKDGGSYEVHYLTARCYKADIRTMTDEQVGWYNPRKLPDNIVSNVEWTLPMANNKYPLKAIVIHESPTC